MDKDKEFTIEIDVTVKDKDGRVVGEGGCEVYKYGDDIYIDDEMEADLAEEIKEVWEDVQNSMHPKED
jgi:hypothetical protein